MIATILGHPPRLRFKVRIQPRASRSRICGLHGSALKIQLTAAPVDGAANAALIALLAETLGIAKRAIRVASGEHARTKVIEIETDAAPALAARLRAMV